MTAVMMVSFADASESVRTSASPVANETAPSVAPDEELDEVVVEANKEKTKRPSFKEYQASLNWLARMVGRFSIDVTSEVLSSNEVGDLRHFNGEANCVGFGVPPNVQCDLSLPGVWRDAGEANELHGVAELGPSVVLYAYDKTRNQIRHIWVDARGLAEEAEGSLINDDVLRSKGRCQSNNAACSRSVRIAADADLKTIEMKIETSISEGALIRYVFVLSRIPGTPSIVYGRKEKAPKK
jgi:hypothetical protein